MTDATPQSIHDVYCAETGMTPNYRVHERAYHDFLSFGFTADDLRLVLRHIKSENKRMNGAGYSLRVDRIFDFEHRRFDSLLSEARAIQRNKRPVPTAREQVQNLRERVVDPEQASVNRLTLPKSFQDVLDKMKVGEG